MPLDYRSLILKKMEERNLTQEGLAELSGISRNAIGSILRNKSTPRFDTAEDILNTLGYEIIVRKIS